MPVKTIMKLPPNDPNAVYTIALPIPPTTRLALIDIARDTGKFVKGILLRRDELLGKRIYGATEYLTVEEIVKTFEEVKPVDGKGAKAVQIPGEAYKNILASKGMPPFIQEELLENWTLNDVVGYYGGATLEESQSVSLPFPRPFTSFIKNIY